MSLINIINKVLGTNLNVTVTNATQETAPEPEESHYVINYNTQEWQDHYIMIRAFDEQSAVRTLLSSRSDIKHFRCECEIEDIIQDSKADKADNLVYVKYTDNKWNYHYVAVNADPENVLGLLVGRYPKIKGAHIQNKIDEVIA